MVKVNLTRAQFWRHCDEMCKMAGRVIVVPTNKALLSSAKSHYGLCVRFYSTIPLLLSAAALASCNAPEASNGRAESVRAFPSADRAVSKASSTEFSTEAARDEAGEAKKLMDWADIKPGTTVADIGAGEGYYTVRLSQRVGEKGRVLAQDINRGALDRLAERIVRERLLDNVTINEGGFDDPRLPPGSFDRIFMVHMYHEIEEPYAFIWRMRPALNKGGQVIVVDRDLPTNEHGIPPKLLFCEFAAVGFQLKEFVERKEVGAYFARFELQGDRPKPSAIKACKAEAVVR
jgi:protein-L-isoaspartate O-methyltransferase